MLDVGQNVRVSRDSLAPHVEFTIAAAPNDTSLLIGAAMVVDSIDMNKRHTTAYVSRDRGLTWQSSAFTGREGTDPQIAFDANGTAYFVDLGPQLRSFTSVDGGHSWGAPIPVGRGYDHPQIGIDGSNSRYRGRAYLAALDGRGWKLAVFRSDDHGRSWQVPMVFADGRGEIGYNVSAALVLSNGALFVPYFDYTVAPDAQQGSQFVYHVWSTTSQDGGLTFGAPRPTRTEFMGPRLMHGLASFATYATDQGPHHRDRIYSVWPDESTGVPRVMFQYSNDAGTTWSVARIVDPSVPTSVWQYQPVVAVNSDGVVGVAWFDTRAASDSTQYDEFFAASVDGGESFLPAVRVSSETSKPHSHGNRAVIDRWGQGGDYTGLAADRGGAFHAFWPDSRSGTFQVMTARITVHPRR